MPWLPWPLPLAFEAPGFADEPFCPPDPFPEPWPADLAGEPMPLVDEEPPCKFDLVGVLPPVAVGGASMYSAPAEEEACASIGRQQNASRASVDRASIERPRAGAETWRVPNMAR